MNKHTIGYIFAIVILGLGVIVVYIALRLFQLKSQAVAPNVPQSTPAATELGTVSCENLILTLITSSPTPTSSATPLSSSSPSPSATPTPTATASLTPTIVPTATPVRTTTATPTLPPDVPVTGTSTPVILGIGAGIVMLVIAIRMAL